MEKAHKKFSCTLKLKPSEPSKERNKRHADKKWYEGRIILGLITFELFSNFQPLLNFPERKKRNIYDVCRFEISLTRKKRDKNLFFEARFK